MGQIIEQHSRAIFQGRSAFLLAASLGVAIGFLSPVEAGPARTETAALPADDKNVEDISNFFPSILSASDISAYRAVFRKQAAGNWSGADKDLKFVRDERLLGHVFAQRYLDRRYKPKYEELTSWLNKYGSLPEAAAIYKAALAKQVKGAKPPPPPSQAATIETIANRATARRPAVSSLGKPDIYLDPGVPAEFVDQEPVADDEAATYFLSGQHQDALTLAESAGGGLGDRADSAHWAAGIAAWRLGLMERAADHFGELAASSTASASSRAAGAYWAARTQLAIGDKDKVTGWLRVAAKYTKTFYGLLAQRALGLSASFNWSTPAFTEADVKRIAAQPAGARSFALLQIGERELAERELRHVRADDPAMVRTLMALALKAELPALALLVGRVIAKMDGQQFDSALYPVPAWQPNGGYHIDKALLFALIRHESEFKTNALSPAGAHGLMQLMPSTASYMAQDRSLSGRDKNRLFEPELNISLGQKYVAYLLDHDVVRGDLFGMIAAYNGGPGNLAKWQRVTDHGDDPLLFVESIPSRETRTFLQKVLASYWIYSARLGQAVPSLDAIANGEWPAYTPPGGKTAAKNARH